MYVAKVLFWLVILIFIFICIGYPLLLALLAKVRQNCSIKSRDQFHPLVTLIIVAYNEASVIAEKLKNSLELDYPRNKLEIIVLSDASSDDTDTIVKGYETLGIKLVRIEGRKGKTYCQNEAVKFAKGEIVVFSDANSMYEQDAIKKIVRHFADPAIGCVSGELRYRSGIGGVKGERAYWRYELMIKRLESEVSSPAGANGAIYAVRKELYEPLRSDVISDFAEPLMIVRKGYRVVHEADAVALENTAQTMESEFRRRVRIVARTVHSILRQPGLLSLLNPFRYKFFAIQIWFHRVLRWLSGGFLLLAIALNLIVIGYGTIYIVILACQVVFYTLALWGLIGDKILKARIPRVPCMVYYFCSSCWAMLLGFIHGLRGTAPTVWTPLR